MPRSESPGCGRARLGGSGPSADGYLSVARSRGHSSAARQIRPMDRLPWPVTVTALRRAARPAGDSETSFLLLSQPGPGTRTTD